MNKATIAVLLVAAGLLGYVSLSKGDTEEPAKPLTVAGCLPELEQAEFRKRKENPLLFLSEKKEDRDKQFSSCPWDEIVFERGGARVVLQKEAEDEWRMVEPVKSEVESFRVKAMTEAFFTDTALTPARRVKNPEHLADFGLDADRRMTVVIKKGGLHEITLVIGNREKVKGAGEQGGADVYDTFVLHGEDAEQVYRAKQKDLRDVFDHDVGAMRSKKVFTFDKTEITKVTIANPASEKAPKIVLSAVWEKPPEEEKGGAEKEGDKPRKPAAKGEFSMVEPTVPDFRLGKLDTYFSQIANLRVTEFVMGEKPGDDTGLNDPGAPTVTVVVEGQDPIALRFGAEKEKDKSFYAAIGGRDEYMIVSKYTKENLLKDLGGLRDKSVFGEVKDEQISRIAIKNEHTGDGEMVFEKVGDAWQMTAPLQQTPFAAEMTRITSGVRTLRASKFVDPPASPADYGMTPPSQRVAVTIAGTERVLLFGEERDSNVKAHVEGSTVWFEVSSWTRNKFIKKPIDFQDRELFGVADPKAIVELELIHASETVKLRRVPGQEKAWEMTEPEAINGASGLADAKAEAIATTLKGLAIKEFTDKATDAVGLAQPAFTLVAKLADGTQRRLLASDTKEGSDHFVAIESPLSTPDKVYTLNSYKLQNLRKKAADLKK